MNKTLLLVGGGHAHVEVLRQLALNPPNNADIALFNPSPNAWYAGMLPGVIAGHYDPAMAKINLWALCQRARVRFFETSLLSLDATQRVANSGLGEAHRFDLISVDVGCISRPIPSSPGAYVVAVKPIDPLLAAIAEFESVRSSQLIVRFVGGGAAALELALALAYRWNDAKNRRISIVAATRLMDGYGPRVRALALRACKTLGVEVLENSPVEHIEPTRLRFSRTVATIDTQLTVLASEYSAAPLLNQTDVSRAPDGRLLVNSMLQSVSHPHLFAAGDCAYIAPPARGPQSANAVLQGSFLAANLLATLNANSALIPCPAEAPSLRLITLGEKKALALHSGLSLASGWAWRKRDAIDRKWISRYTPS